MKINMKMEQKSDDSTRFEKIVKLLPEQKIRLFLDELRNGYYSKGFLEMLFKYKDYSETILSEFKDNKLEKKRKVFNESFQSLLYFLNTHFFSHFNKYALYPELQETPEWNKWFEELHTQIEDFKQTYEEFIVAGKKFLDKISSTSQETTEKEKKKKEKKFPYRLPAGTRWEHITIKFLDKENVIIPFGKIDHETNYEEMGFEDERNDRPDQQWELLRIFAKYEGEITWKTPKADKKIKKTKELLAKRLQNYFSIDYDPFYPYYSSSPGKAKKSYKIKILLIPPPEPKTRKGKLRKDENLDAEIDEIYKEQTPEVYDS